MAVAGLAIAAALLGTLRWKPFRVGVRGSSMVPTLHEGDWAVAVRVRRIRRGQIVVIEHPDRPGFELVKRVVALPGETVGERRLADDEYWVEGDDPTASTDSRRFGPIGRGLVRGRVWLVYLPSAHRRLVRRA